MMAELRWCCGTFPVLMCPFITMKFRLGVINIAVLALLHVPGCVMHQAASPPRAAARTVVKAVASALPVAATIAASEAMPERNRELDGAVTAAVTTGCVLREAGWYPERPVPLRTSLGLVFGEVVNATRAELRVEPAPRLTVELHGVELVTAPTAADVPVYLREARRLGEVVQVGRYTALRLSTGAGQIRVTLPRDPRVQFEPGVSTSAQIHCVDIVLAPVRRGRVTEVEPQFNSFRCGNNRGAPAWEPGPVTLSAFAPIAIAATAGGPVIARVRPPRGTEGFAVDRLAGQTKISFRWPDGPFADAQFDGWVASSSILPLGVDEGGGSGQGIIWSGGASSDWHGCTHEQELWVDAGAGPELIGKILPRTKLRAIHKRLHYTEVELVGPSVHDEPSALRLKPGVRLFVTDAAASDCE
jgi:hypothetical protein